MLDRIDPSEPTASETSMACIVRSRTVPNGYSNPQAPQNLFPPRVQIGFWQLGHLVKGVVIVSSLKEFEKVYTAGNSLPQLWQNFDGSATRWAMSGYSSLSFLKPSRIFAIRKCSSSVQVIGRSWTNTGVPSCPCCLSKKSCSKPATSNAFWNFSEVGILVPQKGQKFLTR
ncbi:MAG: hypothetical protein A2908_01050 [Candidatus Staskawiczbacteria bacterium RIFCSPLOWO2_01_FULL_38_12b]|uniref:Uncharacterized protein n=1 Tax=Candidatus Staskawiczbacteria bacterium RIFCSPLOWO2_01_FULL_38_12b TaxID=1802214 RepID=A0A1G2IEI5_9BACT|nr:MAG: hypothetical protein A2908_01050 [Candidatus Staskawiczbacteria bacterium RIFCSPLOWO2_01_FULL_38_12b]